MDKEYFDHENALADLLKDNILFANDAETLDFEGNKAGKTVILYVLCNDIFAWACADGEDILYDEIEPLYKLWKENPMWGSTKWVCMKRGQQPQKPVADAMKKAGVWDDKMEALKPNGYDAACKEMFEKKKEL